jgi:bacterioferritin-associated ferredoxin
VNATEHVHSVVLASVYRVHDPGHMWAQIAVADAIASGALTCKQIADVCGAGAECGRCRLSVRTMLASIRPRSR